MASGGNNQRGVDGVGVHARLVIVVHRHQSPVGHHARDPHIACALVRLAGDQVLDGRGIEQLHVRQQQHLGQDGAGEQGGVLNNHVVALVLKRHTEVGQEHVGRLAHHHGAEELSAEPGTSAGGDTGLDDGDLEVRAQLAQGVGTAEAAGAGADDDDVRLGVRVEVGKVAAGHGARDGALADGGEAEGVPVVVLHHVGEVLGQGAGSGDVGRLDNVLLAIVADKGDGELFRDCGGSHFCCLGGCCSFSWSC